MSMPRRTKASFYARMAKNQFEAAHVLASSICPRVQSIIWLQTLFLALELSVKAHLIDVGVFKSEADLKNKVGHKVGRYLNKNPKVKLICSRMAENEAAEFRRILSLYESQKLRYLNLELVFNGISVVNVTSFFLLVQKIVEANVENIDCSGIAALLDH